MRMVNVTAAIGVLFATASVSSVAASSAGTSKNNPDRSIMVWLLAENRDGTVSTPAQWDARIANIKAHRENLTSISPCMYDISASGGFGRKVARPGDPGFDSLYPHMKDFQAMGLKVYPLIAGSPTLAALGALYRDTEGFIKAAVADAVKYNWDGYNFDNEWRGKFTDASWAFLKPYGAPWMAFLDQFADALHAVNKTLSVDICGCCGWVDKERPLAPVGHCGGDAHGNPVGFASHEFVGTTCPQYAASKLDRVYAMSSYSLAINGPDPNPLPPYNYTLGVRALKQITQASRTALSWEKYATGIKSGFPYCKNYSAPSTCEFDDTARATINWLGQELKTNHLAHWVDEAFSQAEWDAWGYFLQGASPPSPPPTPPVPCRIHIHHTIGCYNTSDWHSGSPGLLLPALQLPLHDKISMESCATACHVAKLPVAGVNSGSDCFCGKAADLETAEAQARSRPKTECMATACDAAPNEKECGGPGRLLAYQYSCDHTAAGRPVSPLQSVVTFV